MLSPISGDQDGRNIRGGTYLRAGMRSAFDSSYLAELNKRIQGGVAFFGVGPA